MPFFIKTEIIKNDFLLNKSLKSETIEKHISWVKGLREKGLNIQSGFLVDRMKKPGAGGLLIIETMSYKDAEEILKDDPMIKNKLVEWELYEWINVIDTEKQ